MLQDGEGREIDCKNCVFFLTSNLCTDIIQNLCAGPVRPTREELVAAIRPALSKYFKPALLARMEVVPFFTLPPGHLRDIVKLKLRKLSLIHISEPTRLLSISYAVFCLKKK